MVIEVFERILVAFPKCPRLFLLDKGDGPKKINPKVQKKAIVICWLVVWLPFFMFPYGLGMSASQLTSMEPDDFSQTFRDQLSRRITWRATAFAVALEAQNGVMS